MGDIAAGGNTAIQVKGARELAKALRQAGADMQDLKDANRRAADIVAPAAKAKAPRRTGRLAASVRAGATQKAGVIRAGTTEERPVRGPHQLRVAETPHQGHVVHHTRPPRPPNPSGPRSYRAAVERIIQPTSIHRPNESSASCRHPLTTTRVTYTRQAPRTTITVTIGDAARRRSRPPRYMADNDLRTAVPVRPPITFMGYQAYAKLRQMGRTTFPFDKWLATVIQVEDIHKRNRHDDDDPNPTDDGSPGSLERPVRASSASRFGGTPRQWRREPRRPRNGTGAPACDCLIDESPNKPRRPSMGRWPRARSSRSASSPTPIQRREPR